jgi:hypothetical protein
MPSHPQDESSGNSPGRARVDLRDLQHLHIGLRRGDFVLFSLHVEADCLAHVDSNFFESVANGDATGNIRRRGAPA